ncbi:hypothetical protein [Agrobacterium sp. NPDC089420]|uniref:hypothetical protein n=1 Tax=Agrobacterium sp. NPDC089420 TaxID=3363918 RepID=UPI0038509FB9
MTYISTTMRGQLSGPHAIYHSVVKLTLLSVLLLGTSAVALYFAYRIFSKAPVDRPVWLLLIVAGAGLLFFCLRALPKWLTLGAPVLIISQEGLTFRGKPLMRWQDIIENEWVSLGGFGITTGAALHVQTLDRKIKREAITFNCSAREYMRLCELYEHSSGQHADDAPAAHASVPQS